MATAPGRKRRDIAQTLSQPVPGASVGGSVIFLICLLCTGLFLGGNRPSGLARFGSIGVGLGIACSALMDMRYGGLRNLVRTDVMAVLSLYFLTLFEFLFRQETFNTLVSVPSAYKGVVVCLWGFAGLVMGRHFIRPGRQPMTYLLTTPVPSSWFVLLFLGCVFLSYFHMLLPVQFDPFKMVWWWFEPRFTQPWQRGQLGGWKDLLNEFAMLLNLIPPLAGIMVARRRKFSFLQIVLVWSGFLLTMLYGFTCGTRNVFVIFLVTFLIGFAFALPPSKNLELIVVSSICAALLIMSTSVMLEFRNMGLREYWRGDRELPAEREREFKVDNNLYAICRVVEYFPRYHSFLGMEIPYMAVIRIIPRAIWKEKPVGMSFTVEQVFNQTGLTIATSFIGEAYMIGGVVPVFLTGILFGAIAGWWNQIASPKNSELGILIYASGFFAAVITMRSFSVFTTTVLPTIAAILGAKLFLQNRIRARQEAEHRNAQPKRP